MFKRVFQLLFPAFLLYGATVVSVYAQTDAHQIDTLSVSQGKNDTPQGPPSINIAAFVQTGFRSSGCDINAYEVIAVAGGLLKADIYTPASKAWSLFLRAGGGAGNVSFLEAGLGVFYTRTLFASASFAYQQSPECVSHNAGTSHLNDVNTGVMLALGLGRRGFFLELDGFLFFSKERYLAWNWNYDSYEFTQLPYSLAVRLGYSF